MHDGEQGEELESSEPHQQDHDCLLPVAEKCEIADWTDHAQADIGKRRDGGRAGCEDVSLTDREQQCADDPGDVPKEEERDDASYRILGNRRSIDGNRNDGIRPVGQSNFAHCGSPSNQRSSDLESAGRGFRAAADHHD